MSILKNIVIDIEKELRLKKSVIPISEFEKMSLFKRNTISMSNSIKNDNFLILRYRNNTFFKFKFFLYVNYNIF